jgi:hypothetical protein
MRLMISSRRKVAVSQCPRADDRVHLPLGIAPPVLEHLHQPGQHHAPLLPPRRDLRQPTVCVEVVGQHRSDDPRAGRTCARLATPSRLNSARARSRRASGSNPYQCVLPSTRRLTSPEFAQHGQVVGRRRLRHLDRGGQLLHRPLPLGHQPEQPQAAFVRQRLEEGQGVVRCVVTDHAPVRSASN